ncbi:hypothetical protein [Streptomyces sp. JJ38]|uniref:hypothetical protein n=1 Tax=Streptomyces sp. JJ38 TaxID=2738128 RepID=UPI00214AE4D6|nr:hypothetical protein [Streptomyces sp. JJ38]
MTWHRPLMVFAVAMAALVPVSVTGLVIDDRMLAGAPIWLKPLKFSVSFAVYALTLAWMLSLLPRRRRAGWWAGTVVAAAGAVEMVIITTQAVRGKGSHFNVATTFDERLFMLMGLTVVLLWTGTLVIALLLFRTRTLDRAAVWAVRLGAAVSLLGLAVGGLMLRPTPEQRAADRQGVAEVIGAHSVGVPDGGPTMPVTGWSTTGGDLRIPHFVGMHALQALPLLLVVLLALAPRLPRLRNECVRLRLVVVGAGVHTAALALTTWQALRGQPLTSPDGLTLGAAAGIAVLGAAATWLAVRVPPAAPAFPTGATPSARTKEPVA